MTLMKTKNDININAKVAVKQGSLIAVTEAMSKGVRLAIENPINRDTNLPFVLRDNLHFVTYSEMEEIVLNLEDVNIDL